MAEQGKEKRLQGKNIISRHSFRYTRDTKLNAYINPLKAKIECNFPSVDY